MRLVLIAIVTAAAIGLLGAGTPARANYAAHFGAATKMRLQCVDLSNARSYAAALPACTNAAAAAAAVAAKTRNWSNYYDEGEVLEYVALVNSALGHHRASLRTAIQGHQLALYVYDQFRDLDPDDYATLRTLAGRFQAIEQVQQGYIRREVGD